MVQRRGTLALMVAGSAMMASSPAAAELVVSQLVVELAPAQSRSSDIEISNNSDERSYVVVEPREILHPGTPAQESVTNPDPSKLGLLVSPARFILEPGQRRTLRIAAIGAGAHERIYRVTVKPVTGEVSGNESGLKLLVGYDLLVLVRPPVIQGSVTAHRSGAELTLTNAGNSSVEIAEGKQCEAEGRGCRELPAKRLYAGATWKQTLPRAAGGEYRVRSAEGWSTLTF